MYPEERIKRIIAADFPSLRVEKLKLISGGWSNYTYRVNDDLLFKFPKNSAANRSIQREMALLRYLSAHFQILPQTEFVSQLLDDHGWSYFGYRMLPGVFLSNLYSDGLNQEIRSRILKQIAQFLSVLHRVPIENVKDCGVEELSFKGITMGDLAAVRDKLSTRLSPTEHSWLIDLFCEYLADDDNFRSVSAILHGDLRSDHMLFALDSYRLVRVIDFGGAIIGDPDYDLMYLLDGFGTSFIFDLLEYYPHPNPQKLIRKLRFFLVWETVHLILHGIRNEKEDEVNRGLRSLRTSFTAGTCQI
jgi:aminoglycoside 2''-phosphotransferase